MSAQTLEVFNALLQMPQEWRYGYDISRHTGLKSGTVYPILMRLAGHKLLETRWESSEPGKPPRHMYKLTAAGLRFARQHVTSTSKLIVRTRFGSTGS